MKVLNTSARLICVQTGKSRVDIIPGVVTDNADLDKVKGKNKVFDHYLEEGILKVVTGDSEKDSGPTEKELLKAELVELGGTPGNMGVEKLKTAITEALEDRAYELGVDPEGLTLDELRAEVKKAEADQ